VSLAGAVRAGAGAAVAALVAVAGAARAQELTPPDVLVRNVTLEVVDIIGKDKDIQAGDRKKVVALIESKVLPHFNFGAMTASAVGTHWGKASAEQKGRLTDEFRTLMVRTYASSIAAYKDQRFDFRPLRAKPADTDVTVHVRVMQPGRGCREVGHEPVAGAQHPAVRANVHVENARVDLDAPVPLLQVHVSHAGVPAEDLVAHDDLVDVRGGQAELPRVALHVLLRDLGRAPGCRRRRPARHPKSRERRQRDHDCEPTGKNPSHRPPLAPRAP